MSIVSSDNHISVRHCDNIIAIELCDVLVVGSVNVPVPVSNSCV